MSTEAKAVKHTPGPWSIGRTLSTAQTRKWTDGAWDANEAEESRKVFACFSESDEGRSRIEVADCAPDYLPFAVVQANARLIAAAPDLAEALKLFADEATPSMSRALVSVPVSVLEAARTALAKAGVS